MYLFVYGEDIGREAGQQRGAADELTVDVPEDASIEDRQVTNRGRAVERDRGEDRRYGKQHRSALDGAKAMCLQQHDALWKTS
jgi:hypothetical protein